MSKSRALHCLLCFALLFAVLGGLVAGQALAVQENSNGSFLLPPGDEEPSDEELPDEELPDEELPDEELPDENELNGEGGIVFEDVVKLKVDFPVLTAKSGDSVEFEVEVMWMGGERRRFDIAATSPLGWTTTIFTQYGRVPEAQMAAMWMEPRKFFGNDVRVVVEPMPGNRPEPGDYVVTLEASSEDIRGTTELTARVTAKYEFAMLTGTGRLNTEGTAGKDNRLAILLVNSGSAPIENLSFTSIKPGGWVVTYNPEKIDSLEPGVTQELDVIITPPEKTIAGDYGLTLQARSTQANDELMIRVTVLTPTIWGWVGILIVVAVIAGVGVTFWRLGRR